MRVMLRSSALSLFTSFALAAGAQGADHQLHVTEVHTSASNPSMGFVELQDTAAESFLSASYTLASLDASGAVLGRQVFTPPYGFAANAQPFLVTADGRPARDAALTIPLAGARKVCFYRGTGTTEVIHCLTFDSPPEGRSAQLTSSESVVFACPTPDAANKQAAEPCAGPTQPPAGATPPTAAAPPASATPTDARAPGLRLSVRRVQRLGRVRLGVLVDERSTITISGTGRAMGRKFDLVKLRRLSSAGVRTFYRLKLTRAATAGVRRATARGIRPQVTVKVLARDAAGNASVKRLKIILKA